MAPDPGGHAPRPGCRRRPGAQRPRHRRRARSTVSCSLAEDATDPGAARATTPAPRPMTRTSPCSTRCLTLTLTLTRSAGREPGNQNWCREHAPGPRVGPGSGEAGGTQMLGGRRPIPPSPADPKIRGAVEPRARQRAVSPVQLHTTRHARFSQRDVGSCTPVSLGWTKIV